MKKQSLLNTILATARRRNNGTRGQVLPLFALALVGLAGMTALSVDVGYWRYQQRLEQSAADAGAMAGAIQVAYGASSSTITSAAQNDAQTNGFANSGTTTVAVHNPPLTGPNAGNTAAVEVIVTKQQPLFFSGVVTGGSFQNITARAVAIMNQAGRSCVYALSTGTNSLTINNANLSAPQCGMVANGNLNVNNSTVSSQWISYGGSSSTGSSTFTGGSPQKSIPAPDPCPSISGCQYLKGNPPSSGTCQNANFQNQDNVTIPAGTYCQTLNISGCHNVTFSSGTYVLKNGMSLNNNDNVNGSGVTFYNQSGQINGLGSSQGTVSAPSSGHNCGVLVYQPPTNTNSFTVAKNPKWWGNNGNCEGTVYCPGCDVKVEGSCDKWLCCVGNTVTVENSGVNVPKADLPGSGHCVLTE